MKKIIFSVLLLILSSGIYGCNRVYFSSRESGLNMAYNDTQFLSEDCVESRNCQNKNLRRSTLTETFEIFKRNELEILFVIDASQSMDDNLTAVGRHLSSLLKPINKKWRMVFITADHGDHHKTKRRSSFSQDRWEDHNNENHPHFGQFMPLEKQGYILDQKILTSKTPHYEQIFKDTLTREPAGECALPPFCHDYNEQPLRSLKAAIERTKSSTIHQSFFKAHTDTVVIIITDEDERRHDFSNATKALEVLRSYNTQFKGMEKRLFAFSISIQDDACLAQEQKSSWLYKSTATKGLAIARLADLTGGKNVSLCEENYGKSLKNISEHTKKLMHSVTLKELFVVPDTLKVTFIPHQNPVPWKVYGRSLVFFKKLPEGTKIKVSYEYEK